jgi:hypothetical protein
MQAIMYLSIASIREAGMSMDKWNGIVHVHSMGKMGMRNPLLDNKIRVVLIGARINVPMKQFRKNEL